MEPQPKRQSVPDSTCIISSIVLCLSTQAVVWGAVSEVGPCKTIITLMDFQPLLPSSVCKKVGGGAFRCMWAHGAKVERTQGKTVDEAEIGSETCKMDRAA